MEGYRVLADKAMKIIDEHYPEYLSETGTEDTVVQRLAFYMAMLSTVRESPLPNEKSQSILESKISKKINGCKGEVREMIRKNFAEAATNN